MVYRPSKSASHTVDSALRQLICFVWNQLRYAGHEDHSHDDENIALCWTVLRRETKRSPKLLGFLRAHLKLIANCQDQDINGAPWQHPTYLRQRWARIARPLPVT